ncbi:SIMPL domain-containing protein [Streptomyces sp. NPDC059122]|uniref:SIMPL domain-containing protein n=1 Tax=Streptomyces sp. NPDC059122 TaxID=3346732 RepID=UPI0036C94236
MEGTGIAIGTADLVAIEVTTRASRPTVGEAIQGLNEAKEALAKVAREYATEQDVYVGDTTFSHAFEDEHSTSYVANQKIRIDLRDILRLPQLQAAIACSIGDDGGIVEYTYEVSDRAALEAQARADALRMPPVRRPRRQKPASSGWQNSRG